ncbi:MAG: ribonuclease HI [Clostridia bacterium]|nr:ribonuclease HI [Clostridia bacterium]
MLKKVELYTDGACSGNPGAGGWCAILIYNGKEKILSGGDNQTTNNKMELLSIIKGLEALKEKCEVTVYSDSQYAVSPFIDGYISSWILTGWRLANKSPVKNVELWKRLVELTNAHKVNFVKVKGHADNVNNNRCDEIARKEILKLSNNG